MNVIGHFDQHALASSIQYERAFIKNKLRIYGNYSLGYFYKDSRSLHFQAYTFGFLFQPKIFGRYSFRIGHNVSLIDEYKINSREDERHWGIGFKIVQVVRLNKHWLVGVDAQTGLYEGRYKYRNGHGSVNFFPAIFLQVGYSF